MAEILGTASAIVGLAAFVTQVVEKIDALKTAYRYNQTEAPILIESLIENLETFHLILQFTRSLEGHPAVDQVVVKCQTTYKSIDLSLEDLLKRASCMSSAKRVGLKSVMRRFSRDIHREVEEIKSKLDFMISILSLALSLYSVQPPTATLGDSPGDSIPTPTSSQSTSPNSSFIQNRHLQDQTPRALIARKASDVYRSPCSLRNCHCSCHLNERVVGHYWGFEYTPFSALFTKCDNKNCIKRTSSWRLHIALNRFRIQYALVIGLKFASGSGKYTIQPALSVERVVNYTSPGFVIIWKCQNHVITLSEAKESFRKLYESDASLKNDVNPDGKGYIQAFLAYGPWGLQETQFSLLNFLVRECDMTLENEDQRFLIECATWIGEGRHLDLLEMILDNGFDPSNIASPLFQKWPQLSSPDWIAENITPDPFFIEYLAIIADISPGFAGATALHDAVILQSVETVSRLSACSNKLEEDRNFLGQTPLHLASVNMEITRILLDAGHDMDTADKYGITPLMYAAGMGNSQVVQMLIRRGADTSRVETRYERDFISYASIRGHWQLIFESLETIQSCYTERCFHNFVIDAIMELIGRDSLVDELERTAHFEKLIGLCDDVNFTFDIGHSDSRHNNLLHKVKNRREANALLCRGFQNFNQENSDRKLAIHSMAHSPNAELIQFCIENGSNVNHPDNNGRTCLVYLISALSDFTWLVWDTIDSIKLCLARGADIFLPDNCECACVSDGNGCHTSSVFDIRLDSTIFRRNPDIMWAFEWLSIVEEFQGQEASKSMLLSFVRRTQADILDIAHVCCHGGKGVDTGEWGLFRAARPSKEDAREIKDDEAELVEMLEKDMQPWMQPSFEEIRSQWMNLLKEKHQTMIEEASEYRARFSKSEVRKQNFEVDYKNDRFVQSITAGFPEVFSPLSLSKSMAEYAFWLRHEYLRSRTRMESITKEGWYERRMSWFLELKGIMQVEDFDIIKDMHRIDITESRSEKVDGKAITEHFQAFFGIHSI